MDKLRDQTTKRCSRCGKPYPLTGFYRNCTSKDGYRSDCIGCYRATNARIKLRKQEENAKAIAEDRDRKRREMDIKLASMGLLQD